MMIALRLGRSKPFLRATTASSVRGHFYALRALANLMHPVGRPRAPVTGLSPRIFMELPRIS